MNYIKDMIGSFRRIKLSYLAKVLHIKPFQAEQLLIQMIFQRQIRGLINSVEGYFENEDLTSDKQ